MTAQQRATPRASRVWKISFRPYPELFARGNDPLRMLRELAELGTLDVEVSLDALPSFAKLDPQSCYLAWQLELSGNVDRGGHPAGVRLGRRRLRSRTSKRVAAPQRAEDLFNYDLIAEFDAMAAADSRRVRR